MSFVVTVYVPGAIVMAADSRQSIIVKVQRPNEGEHPPTETVNSDFVYKTFLFPAQNIGISTFGDNMLGGVTVESHLKRFQEEKTGEKDDVVAVTEKLLTFFKKQFPDAKTSFHIAGFRKESGVSVPHVYNCQIASEEISRMNLKQGNHSVTYGASWGGQVDIMAALMSPVQFTDRHGNRLQPVKIPIIWDAMPVQDAIDFAIYAVRTTIDTIRFQARAKSVGGPIDVLLLTPEKPTWIQRKQFRGAE